MKNPGRTLAIITTVIFILGILLGAGIGYYRYVYMPQKSSEKFSKNHYEQMLDMYRAGRVVEVKKNQIKIFVEVGKYDKGKEVVFTATPQTMIQIGNTVVNISGGSVDLTKYFAANQNVELLANPDNTIYAIHRELLPGEALSKK
ncbi:MAG: hypothetical protein PWQ23_1936 [Thermoanaerobacter sp.]|nr:hypothetical protein [Thermoanaerobacter sp.]